MKIGKLQIEIWKDTGKPKFRIWFHKPKVTYCWILKIMSYYTLWTSWKSQTNENTTKK